MSNGHDSKFQLGLMMGLLLGGGLVFLLGTRTGKNLLKIISEQGLDGILNLLEEYNFDDLEEYEEVEDQDEADLEEKNTASDSEEKEDSKGTTKSTKKRFFKKVRR